MSKYELTAPKQATLDSLKEKKWEVLGFQVLEKDSGSDQAHFVWCDCSTLTGHWYSDEAAYALMVQRGLRELGEMWNVGLEDVLSRLIRDYYRGDDLLAAIITALEDKDDG